MSDSVDSAMDDCAVVGHWQPQSSAAKDAHSVHLPMEILEEIMRYICVEIALDASTLLIEGWHLRAVCSQWRNCFFSSTRLWNSWVITPLIDKDLDATNHQMLQKIVDFHNARADFLLPLLTRSTRTLAVHLDWPLPTSMQEHFCMIKIVSAVIAESDRWKHLKFVTSDQYRYNPVTTLERMPISTLSHRDFPRLRSLDLIHYSYFVEPFSSFDLFARCGSLRVAKVMFITPSSSDFPIQLPWSQLKELSLDLDTHPEALTSLAECRDLQKLTLYTSWINDEDLPRIAPILLNRLGTLTFIPQEQIEMEVVEESEPLLLPLSLFTLPSLQTLKVLTNYLDAQETIYVNWDSTDFSLFISRSQCQISHIIIQPIMHVREEFLCSLKALHHLTHLILPGLSGSSIVVNNLLRELTAGYRVGETDEDVELPALRHLSLGFDVQAVDEVLLLNMARARCVQSLGISLPPLSTLNILSWKGKFSERFYAEIAHLREECNLTTIINLTDIGQEEGAE